MKIAADKNQFAGSHGKSNSTIHGRTNSRLYRIWGNMKTRCYCVTDPHYKRWGGRGITVCDEWLEFIPFMEWALSNGYKDDLTIDRIDNNKGYSPENCRWATYKEQANNTRRTHYITYKGETHSLTEWAEILGMKRGLIKDRICKLHWSIEDAFETPILERSQWDNLHGRGMK